MHTVAIIAMHGVLPFDLGTACEAFGRVRDESGRDAYRVRVCGEARDVKAGLFDLRMSWDLTHLVGAETVIVPGIADPNMPVSDDVLDALRRAAAGGTRIASICTGAFVLAAAGLLDGVRATTHWQAAPELALRYPKIKVDANALFVDTGRILTSAGAAAGIDLCLHIIRRDHGAAVAAQMARLAVVPLVREGDQSQFMVPEPPSSRSALSPLLVWMEDNLHRPLPLKELAARAAMSGRTFSRRFREQTGTTPLQWLLAARIRRAQQLLERTPLSIERIATEVGFESAVTLRSHFTKQVGVPPMTYRRAFSGESAGVIADGGNREREATA